MRISLRSDPTELLGMCATRTNWLEVIVGCIGKISRVTTAYSDIAS